MVIVALVFTLSCVSSLSLYLLGTTMSWEYDVPGAQSSEYTFIPMKEVILEVLLGLQVCHPLGALELNFIEVTFQPELGI